MSIDKAIEAYKDTIIDIRGRVMRDEYGDYDEYSEYARAAAEFKASIKTAGYVKAETNNMDEAILGYDEIRNLLNEFELHAKKHGIPNPPLFEEKNLCMMQHEKTMQAIEADYIRRDEVVTIIKGLHEEYEDICHDADRCTCYTDADAIERVTLQALIAKVVKPTQKER